MKGWYRFFCISLLTLTLHSCIVSHSAVLTKNIQPGMSIRQIVGLLGQPYKVARHTGDNGQKIETYYYNPLCIISSIFILTTGIVKQSFMP